MTRLPAFLDTSVQISETLLPYDQNQHHNQACICKAFSKHISSSHMEINPVKITNYEIKELPHQKKKGDNSNLEMSRWRLEVQMKYKLVFEVLLAQEEQNNSAVDETLTRIIKARRIKQRTLLPSLSLSLQTPKKRTW